MTKDDLELNDDNEIPTKKEEYDPSSDLALNMMKLLGPVSNSLSGTLLFIMYLYQNYFFEGSSFFSIRFWGLLLIGEAILFFILIILTVIFSSLISLIFDTLIPLLFKKLRNFKTIRVYTLIVLILSSIVILFFITWKFSYYSFAYTYGNSSLMEILNAAINNQDTHTFSNGSTFVGDLKEGDMWNGEYRYHLNGKTFVTEMKDGKIWNGRGTHTYPNGDKYRGEFKEGELTGQVTIIHSNGDIYEGGFKEGRKNGLGTISYINGDEYKGGYKNGKHHGQGKYSFSNGDEYEGGYKDGQAHGRGKYTFSNGNKYEGEFKNYKFNGKGIVTYYDGGKAVGEFKDGDIWNGTIYDKNGKLLLDVIKGVKLKRNPPAI